MIKTFVESFPACYGSMFEKPECGFRHGPKWAELDDSEVFKVRELALLWGTSKISPLKWHLRERELTHDLLEKYKLWSHQIGPKKLHINPVDGIIYEIVPDDGN